MPYSFIHDFYILKVKGLIFNFIVKYLEYDENDVIFCIISAHSRKG